MCEENSSKVKVILANDVATFLDERVESARALDRIEKYLRALGTFPAYCPAGMELSSMTLPSSSRRITCTEFSKV